MLFSPCHGERRSSPAREEQDSNEVESIPVLLPSLEWLREFSLAYIVFLISTASRDRFRSRLKKQVFGRFQKSSP